MKALEIAKYFLFLARSKNAGDTLSNLKLQKMLYYAQGHFLAIYHKPLFDDRIEAWDHGPVVRDVYNTFKKYQSNSVSFEEIEDFETDFISENKEALELLPFIFAKYGSMGAWELREKTHAESPWKDNYSPCLNNEIPQSSIEAFFTDWYKKEAIRLKRCLEQDEEINSYGFL